MDTIKEIISQKFSGAADVIRANSEAEAKELKQAKARIEELEKAVSDMRRLSLKCAETNELTAQLVQSTIEKLEGDELAGANKDAANEELTAELKAAKDELLAVKTSIEDAFKAQEETIHKENIRVYRNVQAAIVDELKQQSEALATQHAHLENKFKGTKPIAIIALVFSGLTFAAVVAEAVFVFLNMGL